MNHTDIVETHTPVTQPPVQSDSMYPDIPIIMTVEEMCTLLKMGKGTAYELIHNGTIRVIRTGRIFHVPRGSVISYLTREH